MRGFKYFIRKHVGKGMMVQTFQDGILKSNHLLFDELFKWKKTNASWGHRGSHATLRCCSKEKVLLLICAKAQKGKDNDQL